MGADIQPNQPNSLPASPPPYQAPLAQVPPQQTPPLNTVDPGKTLGIVGFILAFVGIQVVGLVLSIIGYHKSKAAGSKNGLALAGIWLNSIGIILVGLVIFLTILMIAFSGVDQRADTTKA